MEPIKVASIVNTEGQEVGKVSVTPNLKAFECETELSASGPMGAALTVILNQAELSPAPVQPHDLSIRPRNCPEHTRSVSLGRVVKAISSGALTLHVDQQGMEETWWFELEMRRFNPNAEYITSEEMEERLKKLGKELKENPPPKSLLESLVEEYEAGEPQPDIPGAWLHKFADAVVGKSA